MIPWTHLYKYNQNIPKRGRSSCGTVQASKYGPTARSTRANGITGERMGAVAWCKQMVVNTSAPGLTIRQMVLAGSKPKTAPWLKDNGLTTCKKAWASNRWPTEASMRACIRVARETASASSSGRTAPNTKVNGKTTWWTAKASSIGPMDAGTKESI